MKEVDDILAHHGVLGMKWGVRKDRGGTPSADSSKASAAKTKLKTGGIHTLSNEELQHLSTRMNLEKQVSSLSPASNSDKASKFISSTLANVAKQQVTALASAAAAKQIAKLVKG